MIENLRCIPGILKFVDNCGKNRQENSAQKRDLEFSTETSVT